jgi:flagellar hook-length control protein FliK
MDLFAIAAQNVKDAANADKDRDSRPQNGGTAASNFAAALAKAGLKIDTQAFGVKSDKMLAQAITRQPSEEKAERAAPASDNASPRAKDVAGGKRGAEKSDGRSEMKPGRAERPDAPKAKTAAKKDEAQPVKDDAVQAQPQDDSAQMVTEQNNAETAVATVAQQADDGQPAKTEAQGVVEAVQVTETAVAAVMSMQVANLASGESFFAASTDDQPMQIDLAVVDNAPVQQQTQIVATVQVAAVAVQATVETAQNIDAPLESKADAEAAVVQALAPQEAKKDENSAAQTVQQAAAQAEITTRDPEADAQAALLARIVGNDASVKVSVTKDNAPSSIQSPSSLVANVALIGLDQAPVAQASALADDASSNFQNSFQNGSGSAQTQTAQTPVTAAAPADAMAAATQIRQASFTEVLVAAQANDGDQAVQGVQGAAQSDRAGSANQAQGHAQPMVAANNTQTANAAHATQQAHEVKLPIPPREILNQVNVQIDKAAKEGLDHISIQLRPESLGRIEVRLDLGQDGRVTAMITADRPETLEVLKRDAKDLEKALSDAGLKPDSNSLSFNLRGERQDKNGNANSGQGRSNDASSRGLAMDEAEPDVAIRAPLRRAGRLNGVDVQV